MSECKCGAKIEYNCICWQEQDSLARELKAINMVNDLRRELNQAIKERDEARECLREAVNDMIGRRDCLTVHDGSEAYYKATEAIDRWRKAAGLEDAQ